MQLKKFYNWDAPTEKWSQVNEPCETCKGKGKILNDTADQIMPCPDCTAGITTRMIPPVSGVQVLHAGPKQNFSPNLVSGGQAEGWLSISGDKLTITATNKTLIYKVNRRPGKYPAGRVNAYECELMEEQPNG